MIYIEGEFILVENNGNDSLLLLVVDCENSCCGNKGKGICIPHLLGESNFVRDCGEDGIRSCGLLLRCGFCC